MSKRKYVKRYHIITFGILRPLFRWFLYFRYGFHPEVYKEKLTSPHLILSNHAINFDPFFLTASFRTPIYFVANEQIYAAGFLGSIIRFLIGIIPKSKSRADFTTTKQILQIVREGGTIGIFPEGNSTYTGETVHMPFAIAKLIKHLKIPVLFYHIHGSYFSNPRWGEGVRKGKVTSGVVSKWNVEEFISLTEEEIFDYVQKSLYINAYTEQLKKPLLYKTNKPAHYLERVLFVCPKCRAIETMVSTDSSIACTRCSFVATLDKDGFFNDTEEGFATVLEWDNWQKEVFKKTIDAYPKDTILFIPSEEKVIEIVRTARGLHRKVHGIATLSMTKEKLSLEFSQYAWIFPISDIFEIAIQDKNHLLIYTMDQKTYLIKGEKRRNAYQYLIAYQWLKAKINSKTPPYLGL